MRGHGRGQGPRAGSLVSSWTFWQNRRGPLRECASCAHSWILCVPRKRLADLLFTTNRSLPSAVQPSTLGFVIAVQTSSFAGRDGCRSGLRQQRSGGSVCLPFSSTGAAPRCRAGLQVRFCSALSFGENMKGGGFYAQARMLSAGEFPFCPCSNPTDFFFTHTL